MAKSAILQKEFRNERKMLDVSYRMFRFMVNPKQALIAEAKRLVKDALTGKSKSIYEYGSYVYYETGSPAFGGGIAGCLFPGKSRMSHILFLLLILAETAVAHATIPDGWWFLLPGVVSVLLRLSFKEGQKAEGRKSPALPSRHGRDNYQILLLVLQFPCLWRSRFRQDQIHRQTADGTIHQVRIRRFYL